VESAEFKIGDNAMSNAMCFAPGFLDPELRASVSNESAVEHFASTISSYPSRIPNPHLRNRAYTANLCTAVHEIQVLAEARYFPVGLDHQKQLEFQDAIEPNPAFRLGAPKLIIGPDDSGDDP
jgi:hypothetical protein